MSKDSEEVARCIEGELEALWRFAWRLTGDHDDSVDLVQRTCLRALESADQYNSRGKLRSWLMRIEHRIWLNELRSRQIRKGKGFVAPGTESEHGNDVPAQDGHGFIEPESNLMLHQVHTVVESLPEAQRLVVLLVCVEGFTYREAAEILELPIGTIMSRLSRARLAIGQRVLRQDATERRSRYYSESSR